MAEYIFEIEDALYNEETGETVMKPVYKGKLTRCKDCKWYEKDFGCDWGVCFHNDWTVGSVGNGVDSDGYCYRAERKEE